MKWKRSSMVDGYESADGRWLIEHQTAYTFCENPHPMGKGGGYCPGGAEHEYRVWVLWHDGLNSERIDANDRLRPLKDMAERIDQREEAT